MRGRYCYKDVWPFTAMVTMECINVGLNTLFKAATLQGMSYHVFVVYAYAIAALVLFPAPFISRRMEKVALRSRSSQAKIWGTIISISGAFVVTLYKGPPIFIAQTSSVSLNQPLNSLKSNWVIGGLLLTAEYILVPLWYIVQAQIMKEYPNELTVIFFYNLTVSIIAAVVGLITEKNPNAWRLRPNIALVSVVCSGIFGSFINNTVHAWALRVKGPLFVAMFKPLSIAIAVAMGVMFLSDTLHLGSLFGATIISFGFYTVMWGKAKEEIGVDHEVGSLESPSTTQKTPLLQSYKAQEV